MELNNFHAESSQMSFYDLERRLHVLLFKLNEMIKMTQNILLFPICLEVCHRKIFFFFKIKPIPRIKNIIAIKTSVAPIRLYYRQSEM